MANTYKNIVITPNTGSSTGDPTIVFSGGDTTTNTDITLKVYSTSNGSISIEGSAGQLFSITNDLSNTIFSVNDVSGIPLVEVNVTSQQITFGQFYGNVGIGTNASNSSIYKLDVAGIANISTSLIVAGSNVLSSFTSANNYAGAMANSSNAYARSIANDAASITTGTVALARGGTSASLTAVNGGLVYSTASAMAITAAGTANQVPLSIGAGAPVWSTLTLEHIPGAFVKKAAKAATTTNITLSGAQTIDGISIVAGDRVLVKDQTLANQNGIYTASAAAWARSGDADSIDDLASALIAVDLGTTNGGKLFDNDLKTTDVLNTTAITWRENIDSGNIATFAGPLANNSANSANNYAGVMANAANAVAATKVASVSGTSGRITNSGTTAVTLDLATAGAGAATYSSGISAVTVDAYGRVTSVTGSAGYLTGASTVNIGTTNFALNRASATQSLTGVNIDGSAGSATNATNAAFLRQTDATGILTPVQLITTSGARGTSLFANSYNYGIFSEFKNSSLFSSTGNYSGLITYSPWQGTTASTGDPSYQLLFSPSAANATGNPVLKIRAGIDTTWGTWNTILHSNNFAVSSNSTARLWANTVITANTETIYLDLATSGVTAAAYSSGISAITVDAYGRVTSVTGSASYATTTQLASYLPLAGGTMTGLLIGSTAAVANVSVSNDSGSMSIRGSTTAPSVVSFHRAGAYAINVGLDTDNIFKIGGWSDGVNTYRLQLSAPAGTSNLNSSLTLTGNMSFTAANPSITASSYITLPGGLYVSGGTPYFQNQSQHRGGIHNDTAAYLTIAGGTAANTYFTGNVGIGTTSTTGGLTITSPAHASGTAYEVFKTNYDANWGLRLVQNYVGAGDIHYEWKHEFNGVEYESIAFKGNNVGIGNTAPAIKLEVNGNMSVDAYIEFDQIIATSYTITTGRNALTAGPVTINNGITVTVPSGSTWTIV